MHKGQAGRIAIVAGSRGMSGAAVLCGLGALRGGAGLVRVCCPASIQPIVAASAPELLTTAIRETRQGALDRNATARLFDDWADVYAVGPGLGAAHDSVYACVRCAMGAGKPVVLDADALNALARREPAAARGKDGRPPGRRRERRGGPLPPAERSAWNLPADKGCILTPHPGEMRRLCAAARIAWEPTDVSAARAAAAGQLATFVGGIVVLKGHQTVVSDGRRLFVNTTGNPGMATGGMGDVLTGLIAALVGQRMTPFDACVLGVYAHGLAADRLAARVGPAGYLAREVADELPAALAEASRSRIGFL